jgi:multisubunit Na+/H+ antiporter MnhC subunit
MSTTTIVIIVAIVAVIAVLAARGRGPRVTHIETRRETEERKNGDDA